jgi:hypothetical protein
LFQRIHAKTLSSLPLQRLLLNLGRVNSPFASLIHPMNTTQSNLWEEARETQNQISAFHVKLVNIGGCSTLVVEDEAA